MTDPTGDPAPVALGYFASDEHALDTGIFIGALLKAGFEVRPETDDIGNYLPKFTVIVTIGDDEPPIEVCVKVLPEL